MIEIECGRALWVYRSDDEEVMRRLRNELALGGFVNAKVWQNKSQLKAREDGMYPQYLCSVDLFDLCGDVVHFWRDGQTWWPVSGDYSFDDEEKAERILRQAIEEFSEEKNR